MNVMCVFTYVYMHVTYAACMCACTYVHMGIVTRSQCHVSFLITFSWFLRQGLSLSLELTDAARLTSYLWRLPVSVLHHRRVGVADVCHAWFSMWALRSELRSSRLQDRHISDWAIFPVLTNKLLVDRTYSLQAYRECCLVIASQWSTGKAPQER